MKTRKTVSGDSRKDIPKVKKSFDLYQVIDELKQYLPDQAPLKDFVHHNTLHAFQDLNFHQGLRQASSMFGYKTYLTLQEFRNLYKAGSISSAMLEKVIREKKGVEHLPEYQDRALYKTYLSEKPPRIGSLRSYWKTLLKVDLDSLIHPTLFRILASYLDQGISLWSFPVSDKGFLASIRELEQNSFSSFFRTKRARSILFSQDLHPEKLLELIAGDEKWYKQYLFDQQFAHPGWSGMVSVVEDHPEKLLDKKNISLYELILFELLLELDILYFQLGTNWQPLCKQVKSSPEDLFTEASETEHMEILSLWQEAYEWSYYDQVLAGLMAGIRNNEREGPKTFQAVFCIDDRSGSVRDYLEKTDPRCDTFGTPGHFNIEFYFQPQNAKHYTKQCPASVKSNFLIKEIAEKNTRKRNIHFHKYSHTLLGGWLISQGVGFWSALKLFLNVFWPSGGLATTESFSHMNQQSKLTIEAEKTPQVENGLQVGFTTEEMAERVEGLLRSIGLVKDFAALIYIVGHGSSSVNNPHYAAYDCGACSGRPGSVNARIFSFMANHPVVRSILASHDIIIPDQTRFVGALHDTCRDDICFYDEDSLSEINHKIHQANQECFAHALSLNAKERSRRMESVNTRKHPEKIRQAMRKRSVSLFEPRPELNHATNSLCIIGRRKLTNGLFLDRRAFLNSYDYRLDQEGKILSEIMKAAAPVCGGINLEYYFSGVDNHKLGAGTKLPHNVIGLFGVANGTDGDLRPGLPSQMIETHDPIRLLMIVEHFPEVVLQAARIHDSTYQWFEKDWIKLAVIHPETGEVYYFRQGVLLLYTPYTEDIPAAPEINLLIESIIENIPVCRVS